ncbi:bifunctional hydroxymethylpyrimidine kinase/phosphomethylpyrimidine kinase [Sneathiella chungangensis]|uniref:hydroxymethylpyrimidine kinase n=1 Tax=Sneathiella chungangensis TaxID=1418234 RepID=A0A845MFB6_9PROT|nr:bifunctional hydroxymethylpyrimidine kinase/phosphomethylpyrimidine kinase [Sneathiella chungangensis]MZR22110.1 bifunctional hydroxymethylpyrimidine kinase/phosphomethylpyrimidine kinase [Sneathiella chungangensis]
MQGRVLIIAGSDSGGGAGIQADIKTVTALGGYAATAITALTAQNTLGVEAIEEVSAPFVARQIDVVLKDIGADAIKIGMLHRRQVVEAIADVFDRAEKLPPVVLDPVMIAKGGASLIATEASEAIMSRLIGPHTHVLTPNIPEAEHLTRTKIDSLADMEKAGRLLLSEGPAAILMKGGHRDGMEIVDILLTKDGIETFSHRRIESRSTHGTGCTLSSAIATGLAQGLSISKAVARAIRYVENAIFEAPGIGAGHGPLNHGHTVGRFD